MAETLLQWLSGSITVDFWRPELDYVESVVDVHFISRSSNASFKLSVDHLSKASGYDGLSEWWINASGYITKAVMHLEPDAVNHTGLFLHELGHVLGLDHPDHAASLSETIMAMSDGVGNYTAQEAAAVAAYAHADILDLWARYGVSREYLGDIVGDSRNNTLYGGTHEGDALDNSEALLGLGGTDLLYGNGGDDTIFGGAGVNDAADQADTIYGGVGNDLIYGNGGDDVIYAGSGRDTIYGGLGRDVIYLGQEDVIGQYDPLDVLIYS